MDAQKSQETLAPAASAHNPPAPEPATKQPSNTMQESAFAAMPDSLSPLFLGQAFFMAGLFVILGEDRQFRLRTDSSIRRELKTLRIVLHRMAQNADEGSTIKAAASEALRLYDTMKMPEATNQGMVVETAALVEPIRMSDIRLCIARAVEHAWKHLTPDDAALYCNLIKQIAGAVAQSHDERGDLSEKKLSLFNFVPVLLARLGDTVKASLKPGIQQPVPVTDLVYDPEDPNDTRKVTRAELMLMSTIITIVDTTRDKHEKKPQ